MIQLAFLVGDEAGAMQAAPPLRLEQIEVNGGRRWRISGVWPHRDLGAARRQVAAWMKGLSGEGLARCLFTGREQTVGAWRESLLGPVTVASVFQARHAVVEGGLFARLFGLYQLGESDVVLVADGGSDVDDVYEILGSWARYRLAPGEGAEEPRWDRPFPLGYWLVSFADHEVGDEGFWALMRERLGSGHLRHAFDERMEAPAPRVFIEAEEPSDPDTGYGIGVDRALAVRRRQRETARRLERFYSEGAELAPPWVAGLSATKVQSPNAQDAAGVCDRLASRPRAEAGRGFFAYREAPRGPLDSGWRFGCLEPDHVHDASTLRIVPLGQAARPNPGVIDYLGLPPGWALTWEEGRFWTTPPGETRSFPDEPMGGRPPVRMETPMGPSAVSLGPAPASAIASGASSGAPTAPAAALRGPSLPFASAVSLGPAPASAVASGASSGAPTAPAAALRGPSLPFASDEPDRTELPELPELDDVPAREGGA